ncbi:MAG: protease modulator HflC [Gammaproteobacteria bacterium]|nr:protease modulator HflC [Gammaproteobacteria bacterium]
MTPARIMVMMGALLLIWLLSASLFVVKENELAIRFRLGEFVNADYDPGLHMKFPFINNVKKFDRRILTLDASPVPYMTLEKKPVIVDSFLKWRIADLTTYYKSMRGQEFKAGERLGKIVQEGLRNEFAKRTIQEAISGERTDIMREMQNRLTTQALGFGIEVVDVRIKRIELPSEVSESVYKRMRSERNEVATMWRAGGKEIAERTRADADRERTVILADATREAEKIRGDGDAKAAEIYADAFTRNAEFYDFYRSMDAYTKVFTSQQDTLVLDTDSDFFRYFKNQDGKAGKAP